MPSENTNERDIAAQRHTSMSRRRFLRGVGAVVAMPALPSLLPRITRAAEAASAGTGALAATAAPQRMG